VLRNAAGLATRTWRPGSRLFLVGENANWVIDHELAALGARAAPLGIRLADTRLLRASRGQAAFYGSQFTLLGGAWQVPPHRLGVAYFHGRPGTPGMPEFDECYRALCARHEQLERVQVSHSEIEEVVLSSGIDPAKVRRIPIGIELAHFTPQTPERRAEARLALGLPESAFVVGSFQKDGVGWGEGTEPKLIKGPDVLLAALAALDVPELHVLLSGPARGYVKAGLEQRGIPYVHRLLDRYEAIGELYAALDAYVVPSRQEGGPKGLLEAAAAGVPLVTTRVGQAMDLVRHGENGWVVEPEDAEGLARWLGHVASGPPELASVVAAGLETAHAHSYDAQLPLWRAFFDGFVERR
jgi:glycosyltransferase involved in cell wall biosynthesis